MRALRKRSRTRTIRRVLSGATALAGGFAAIIVAAERDVAREGKAREYLGDQLYTEIRGEGDPMVFLAGVEMIHRAIHFNKRVAFTDDNLK